MNRLRKLPEEVPNPLYIVHDPSNDQPPGILNHSSRKSYSPHDIGFRPFNLLTVDAIAVGESVKYQKYTDDSFHNYYSSIYVTVTDDVEAARNEVITSQKDLVMYELNSQCDEMKLCAVFEASSLQKGRMIVYGRDEDEDSIREKEKKVRSEWVVWPGVPKEAISKELGKEEISDEIEREQLSLQNSRVSKQKSIASSSRHLKQKTATKGKGNSSLNSNNEDELGLVCNDVDRKGKPQYTAIASGKSQFPFSTIYMIEQRKAGIQCLIHWGPDTEPEWMPEWLPIQKVDSRAVADFQKRQAKAGKKRKPNENDPYEIIFEEAPAEDADHNFNSRFLVRWTDTGLVTWETYGSFPGVARIAGRDFLEKQKTWKRYQYLEIMES